MGYFSISSSFHHGFSALSISSRYFTHRQGKFFRRFFSPTPAFALVAYLNFHECFKLCLLCLWISGSDWDQSAIGRASACSTSQQDSRWCCWFCQVYGWHQSFMGRNCVGSRFVPFRCSSSQLRFQLHDWQLCPFSRSAVHQSFQQQHIGEVRIM